MNIMIQVKKIFRKTDLHVGRDGAKGHEKHLGYIYIIIIGEEMPPQLQKVFQKREPAKKKTARHFKG